MVNTRDEGAESFEPHRRHLMAIAYRMLGSVAEAEDVVQEAYLRWHDADRAAVLDPLAFLSRVATRLCLDHLKSARVRREHYVGPWLPEPVLDDSALASGAATELAEDVSVALMLALERLTPAERAAFLLHDVFDLDFAEVATALGKGEAACRQLAARARAHMKESRPRFEASPEDGARLAGAFLEAAASGDTAALTRLLAEDAVVHTDGGGRRQAALALIRGRDKAARFFAGIARKPGASGFLSATPARINGLPGFLLHGADGGVETLAIDHRDGQIVAIYIIRNPEKLRHLAPGPQADG